MLQSHAYDTLIASAAQIYGVDPALVKAHMAAESAFNPRAYRAEPKINDASYGLMQLLWRTAQRFSNVAQPTDDDQTDLTGLYAPGVNIPIGAHLIADNLQAVGGDLDAAIAAYNEGVTAALADRAAGRPWRTYDPNYVAKVKSYQATFAADFQSPTPDADTSPPSGTSPGLQALGFALLSALGVWAIRKWLGA